MPAAPVQPNASVFGTAPPDPAAACVSGPTGGNDTPTIQRAIDEVKSTDSYGLVLVPQGTYRIESTVYLPLGIRLIGYGDTRPVFLLPADTPAFQQEEPTPMVHVCNLPPTDGKPVVDADFVTFWSGIDNIDIEMENGNTAAAVRFNVAQHSYLRHMDFSLAHGCIGISRAGNEIEECRFFGGRAAISTLRTSACWPFTMLDCLFDGQAEAAVQSCRAGITAVRCRFRNTPTAFAIREDGDIEQLLIRQCRFEDISSRVIRSGERANVENMVNVTDSVCIHSPVFLGFEDGSFEPLRTLSPTYVVDTCSHGLHIEDATRRHGPFGAPTDLGSPALLKTILQTRGLEDAPPPLQKDHPDLPAVDEWANVRDAGATGNGATDDTEAFKKAIADHRVVYVPTGRYLITDTLALKKDTVIIGLQPIRTLFVLPADVAGFGDAENPKPVMESPPDGSNLVTGIGFCSNPNPGAVMLKWQAGADSCVDDVWFGMNYLTDPEYLDRWTRDRSEDWRPDRPVESTTKCGLWVTGGGTLKNIWTADWSNETGLLISDTSTPGQIYGMSIEHHLGNEVRLQNVTGWSLNAVQTEADLYAQHTLAIEMSGCREIDFGNLFTYRRVALETSHPHAVRIEKCTGLVFRGLHVFSWGPHPFSNSVYDADTNVHVRHREIAFMTVKSTYE